MRRGVGVLVFSAAAAVVLSACGGHTGVLEHPATTAAVVPGVSSASSTTPGVDVAALWQQITPQCNAFGAPIAPLADPYGFNAAQQWVTDDEVQRVLDSLHPFGDEAFTRDHLVTLWAGVIDTRARMANTVQRATAASDKATTQGRDVEAIKTTATNGIERIHSDWQKVSDLLTREIDAGADEAPDAGTTAAMQQVEARRATACQ